MKLTGLLQRFERYFRRDRGLKDLAASSREWPGMIEIYLSNRRAASA